MTQEVIVNHLQMRLALDSLAHQNQDFYSKPNEIPKTTKTSIEPDGSLWNRMLTLANDELQV